MAALMLTASCGEKENTGNGEKKEPTFEDRFCKEWHSYQMMTLDIADIYLDFSNDGTFEMYQKIGEGAYRLYRGTWSLDGNMLSGKYNDGEDWSAVYEICISDKFMTMTSQNDAAEENVFEECTIPEEVRETCEIVVRSHAEFTPAI